MFIIDAILGLALLALIFGCWMFWQSTQEGGGSGAIGLAAIGACFIAGGGGVGFLFALIKLTLTVGW